MRYQTTLGQTAERNAKNIPTDHLLSLEILHHNHKVCDFSRFQFVARIFKHFFTWFTLKRTKFGLISLSQAQVSSGNQRLHLKLEYSCCMLWPRGERALIKLRELQKILRIFISEHYSEFEYDSYFGQVLLISLNSAAVEVAQPTMLRNILWFQLCVNF